MIRKSNFLVFATLTFMLSISFIFQSCEEVLLPTQNEIISESKEFEDYVAAHYEFTTELQSFNNSKKKIGQVNGKNVYRKVSKSFDTNLFLKVLIARNNLLDKYPEYSQISAKNKNYILEEALSKSAKLSHIIPLEVKSPTIRLKSGNVEGGDPLGFPNFFTQWFSSYDDAYDACKNYSQTNKVESGGYIFPNGLALFVVDSLATDTTMSIPIWSGIGALATFHFHPGGTTSMSPTDSLAVQTLQSFGVDSVIIITNDTIQGYGF